jgi:hypothetical protein
MAWGLKKRIPPALSHRWNKTRRSHWILIYVSPQEFINLANAGATGLFCGHFKTFLTAASPPPQKIIIFQNRISNALNWIHPADLQQGAFRAQIRVKWHQKSL